MKPNRIPADLAAYICEVHGFTGDEAALVRGATFDELYAAHGADDRATVPPQSGAST